MGYMPSLHSEMHSYCAGLCVLLSFLFVYANKIVRLTEDFYVNFL